MVVGISRITVFGALSATAVIALVACGGSGSGKHGEVLPARVPPGTIVVRVGNTPITRAQYEYWMRIGDATVEKPSPTGPLPKPVAYEPPSFTACIAHIRTGPAASHVPASQLRAQCRLTYKGIEERILRFLIRAYWLREEAAAKGLSVSTAEVRKEFYREKQREFPTAAAYRRLLMASHQTASDLMFAVRTQMLATRLLQKFTESEGRGKSQEAATDALNKIIDTKWTARTICRPGYIVIDCRRYH